MNRKQATELMAMAAMANLPEHAAEAQLVCEAVSLAAERGGNAHQRAQLFLTLLHEQARSRKETQSEFSQMVQSFQGQQSLKI